MGSAKPKPPQKPKAVKHAAASASTSAASSPASPPTTVAGFTVLPVLYAPAVIHYLYAHAHSAPKHKSSKGKEREELPEGRTLFLVNVPPDATERELTVLFKSAGTVEKVVFSTGPEAPVPEDEDEDDDEKMSDEEDGEGESADSDEGMDSDDAPRPSKKRKADGTEAPKVTPLPAPALRHVRRTGHTAFVVFLDASSLARALTPPPKPPAWPTDAAAPRGLEHFTALYRAARPPLDVVRAHADSWVAAFEHAQAAARQGGKYRMGEAVVDEDGFTLVTRGGAYGKTLGGGVGVASKRFVAGVASDGDGDGKRGRRKKEKKEKEAFYAFQIHEKKRKDIIDLKRKFEEDKEKIEKLKQSRKFKPY
ncbi:ribosomal RNA-processing protein 7-domain-containing protein [Epithele typhae]|uniref:ribosomal RNA-processing protein 7-domain-containing protein n=1 Tax=Epithele typhae TaxID=378194 RepID=UPI00200852AC|nr:ribosomal RNA-processing protein 7-domain-containing protein [Epithele typhae]KAH9927077.1 ribosomal RNA-processing protein 7-domain-containing protein [Epithele typhae]